MSDPIDITEILKRSKAEPEVAAAELFQLIYDELRQIAAGQIKQEKSEKALQATALVHEAYLRLVDVPYNQQWEGRRHFFGAAAEAMRRVLIDYSRRRNRIKRGGDQVEITITLDNLPEASTDDVHFETLHEAIERFASVDPTACELVKLRYFAGLTQAEAASVLSVPRRTADRLWAYARAWLRADLKKAGCG